MQTHTFVADSAHDAVTQIREQLGPKAVVLSVRKLPVPGLGRLWQKSRIEVTAHVPEAPPPEPDPLAEIKMMLTQLREQIEHRDAKPVAAPEPPALGRILAPDPPKSPLPALAPAAPSFTPSIENSTSGAPIDPAVPSTSASFTPAWPRIESAAQPGELFFSRTFEVLENMGILPIYAQQLLEQLRSSYGDQPPKTMVQEVELACNGLKRLWRQPPEANGNVHIFIGPPGTGKTTCLCKWLAQSVLLEGSQARVWRLDGTGPNAAESLSVYAEILGVPLERFVPPPEEIIPVELLFIDLPGINWKDASALEALQRQVADLPAGRLHLVLNGAYEISLLLQQVRAFSSFPVSDLIVSHLDEEVRWGKLWNLVLGTNYSIGWISAGQNIPGEFRAASAPMLFRRQMGRK